MAEITCEVVKDLLPLYVDDVLSNDSRNIVEEHLKTCKECTDLCKTLKSNDGFILEKNENDKAAMKKIKTKIKKKTIVTALVSALCIAAIAIGVFYGVFIRESYIPFDESGLSVSGDSLQTNRDFNKSYGWYTPDGKTCFMYLTTTVYTSMKGQNRVTAIEYLNDESRRMEIMDENGATESFLTNTEIYYLSEETIKQFENRDWTTLTNEDIESIKEKSALVWSAE